jgi:maltooligosyltrehalose trehalohydrolase
LFMGEEFGCTRPFLYFADFEGDLAAAVREGRRREFASFERFRAGGVEAIPDPMDVQTFLRSKLDWSALEDAGHRRWLELCRKLLTIRRRWLAPRLPALAPADWRLVGDGGLAVSWMLSDDSRLSLLANLGSEPLAIDAATLPRGRLLFAESGAATGDGAGIEPGPAPAAEHGPAPAAEPGPDPRAAARPAGHLEPWAVRWHLQESQSR